MFQFRCLLVICLVALVCESTFAVPLKCKTQFDIPVGCRPRADVVVSLDVSGSVGAYGINEASNFTRDLIKAIAKDTRFDIRFGLVQFRGESQDKKQKAVKLESLPTTDRKKLLTLLNGTMNRLQDGWTRIDKALDFTKKCVFQDKCGLHYKSEGAPLALVVTDGAPEDAYIDPPCYWFTGEARCPIILDQTIKAAESLRYAGIALLSVGVGDLVQLQNILDYTAVQKNVVVSRDTKMPLNKVACRIVEYAYNASIAKCSARKTASFGDPHVRTLDGLAVTYLGCGDQVMLRDVDAGVMYQARHCNRGNEASSTCAIALRCGAGLDGVEVYATGPAMKFVVAGKEWTLPQSATFTAKGVKVVRSRAEVTMTCECGLEVTAHVREAAGVNYLDTFLSVPKAMRARTRGLLGQWDDDRENDIAYPDGTVWNLGHGLDYVTAIEHPELDALQAAWTVKGDESLFHLTAKDTNAECKETSAAQRRSTLGAVDQAVKAQARELCGAAGLAGPLLETCMFDYIASNGNLDFVRNAALLADLL